MSSLNPTPVIARASPPRHCEGVLFSSLRGAIATKQSPHSPSVIARVRQHPKQSRRHSAIERQCYRATECQFQRLLRHPYGCLAMTVKCVTARPCFTLSLRATTSHCHCEPLNVAKQSLIFVKRHKKEITSAPNGAS